MTKEENWSEEGPKALRDLVTFYRGATLLTLFAMILWQIASIV
jgi:hypothetical protein